jgi:hypothetical protein
MTFYFLINKIECYIIIIKAILISEIIETYNLMIKINKIVLTSQTIIKKIKTINIENNMI